MLLVVVVVVVAVLVMMPVHVRCGRDVGTLGVDWLLGKCEGSSHP